VLRRDEEDGVGRSYPLAKLRPYCRRILVSILVVDRQVPDFDDVELQRSGRKLNKRVGHLSVDRILPQTADDHGYVACLIH
jgi:hypothetical protein